MHWHICCTTVHHSYLYALTRRPPVEPVKEWDADKVGQKSFFFVKAAHCVEFVECPDFLRGEDAFFAFLLSYWVPETFPFILLLFQWCVSSARADKSVFGLPVSFFFPFLCASRETCLIIPPLSLADRVTRVRAYATHKLCMYFLACPAFFCVC